MTPAEIEEIARRVREGGMPDSLNRWLAMLPAEAQERITMIRITTNLEAARYIPAAVAAAAIPSLEPSDCVSFPCPSCGQPAGSWCRSASGKRLPELHSARRRLSAVPCEAAETTKPAQPAAIAAEPVESEMKNATAEKVSASKIEKTTSKNRREPGSRPAAKAGKELPKKPDIKATTAGSGPKPRNETKTELVDRLLHSKLGVTREKLSEATGWPSVNLRVAASRRPDHYLLTNEEGRFRLLAKAEFEALASGEAQLWTKVKL